MTEITSGYHTALKSIPYKANTATNIIPFNTVHRHTYLWSYKYVNRRFILTYPAFLLFTPAV